MKNQASISISSLGPNPWKAGPPSSRCRLDGWPSEKPSLKLRPWPNDAISTYLESLEPIPAGDEPPVASRDLE
jgi:hypothetical protein